MKSLSLLTLLVLPLLSLGKEIPNPPRQEKYDSGLVHETLMSKKRAAFSKHERMGAFNAKKWPKINKPTPCVNGKAGEFRCENIDLWYFASHADLGSATGQGSSSWGWTYGGREFIIIAQVCYLLIGAVTGSWG